MAKLVRRRWKACSKSCTASRRIPFATQERDRAVVETSRIPPSGFSMVSRLVAHGATEGDTMKLNTILSGSLLAAALLLAHAPVAAAADCAVTYTRTACAGQEAESFAKCDGKATCTKDVEAASEAACQEAALKACANDRLTVTQSKVINATF